MSAAGSSDPENQALSYAWDLGDGTTSSAPELLHTYTGTENYVARLTVSDSEGLSDAAEVRITPNNLPPVIEAVLDPAAGSLFVSDEPLALAALASDPEDGLPAARWTLDLIHDHHLHTDWATSEGLSSTLVPESHGPGDNHFRVRLTVSDSRGSQDERELEIYDRNSRPQAHLDSLVKTRVRVGQRLAPVGHVDFALGQVLSKQPRLVWDWGDGTQDVFMDARHHVDTRPTHVYAQPGLYKLRLIADLEGQTHAAAADIEVLPPRPSVAVFAPLEIERWVPRAEQQALIDTLPAALLGRAAEVRAFSLGRGADLAEWMASLEDDSLADVLVLLDFVPTPLVAAGPEGSAIERWIQGGNGIVWSGMTPFLTRLSEDGIAELTVNGTADFFGTADGNVVEGVGLQRVTALGAQVLPSLRSYRTGRGLRYDLLGPEWSVERVFAEDGDRDSDAIEIAHASRGYYVHLLCDADAPLRPAVITEYLRDRLANRRQSGPPPRKR